MLQNLRGEDEIVAPSIRREAEDVRLLKGEPRVARARLGDRVGAEIDADIAPKRNPALKQFVEKKRLAAAEIENARGR